MDFSQIDKNWSEAVSHELGIRGWGSKTKLAEALGIKTQTLSGWLNGHRRATEEERRRICDELGMDYASVINGSQTATADRGATISQVTGHGNTVKVMARADVTEREWELITALRKYGNPEMVDAIMARLAEIRRMSKFE